MAINVAILHCDYCDCFAVLNDADARRFNERLAQLSLLYAPTSHELIGVMGSLGTRICSSIDNPLESAADALRELTTMSASPKSATR